MSVSFIGITHTSFTNSVLSGTASSATTIDVTRSSFSNFQSAFVVRQLNDNGITPFKVQISESTISNAMGGDDGRGTIFVNLGGELSIQDVIIDSSNLMSIVTTGSANATEGSTFLRKVTVKDSNVLVRMNFELILKYICGLSHSHITMTYFFSRIYSLLCRPLT